MRGFWLFLHVMGFVAWLGGGLAVMLSGITAKYFPPDQRLAVYRVMSVVSRNLIGPGAVLVVISGIVLSVPYYKSATVPTWLMAMQTLGFLGAVTGRPSPERVTEGMHSIPYPGVDVTPSDLTAQPHVFGGDLIEYLTGASVDGPGTWDPRAEAAWMIDPARWYTVSFEATPHSSVVRWVPPEGSGLATVACLVIGYPLAYAISLTSGRIQNLLLLAVITPFWSVW